MSTQPPTEKKGGALLPVLFGIVMVIVGLPLLVGGVQLIGLGGSWYYALAGLGVMASGVLFAMRRRAGLWLYGLVFVATIAWALWESGLSFWPLVPRLVAPTVLAILALLVAPLLVPERAARFRVPLALAALLALGLAVTGVYAFRPHEVIRNEIAQADPTPAPPRMPPPPPTGATMAARLPARAMRRSTRSTRTMSAIWKSPGLSRAATLP